MLNEDMVAKISAEVDVGTEKCIMQRIHLNVTEILCAREYIC